MNIIKITNKDDERLAIFFTKREHSLKNDPKYENGLFVVESSLLINRALDKKYKAVSFLIVEATMDEYKDIFNRCDDDIVIYEVCEEIYRSLKGYVLIRGILAVFERQRPLNFDEVIVNKKRIVVLEDVTNPTNVGAIFRNCAALFVDGVLLSENTCDPLYRRSLRTSMGNVFNIDYAYVNTNNYIDLLHKNGFKIVSFALTDNSVEIDDETLNSEEKLAIVFGNEGYGLNKITIDNSDYVVRIPMNKQVDSLNVVSSSGIALWQLCKNNNKK